MDTPKVSPADIAKNAPDVDDQKANWKDADLPEDLKATWDEKEKLRPMAQAATDLLIGDGVLRDPRRSRNLDDLDGEPE